MEAIIPEHWVPLTKYREMRASAPVHYNEKSGAWSVYKYDDVKTVLANHDIFSSQIRAEPLPEEPIEASVLRQDPPKHRQLRALVSQAFTPHAVEALVPLIVRVTDELLERAEAHGAMEAVGDFASTLPVLVIAELLGIPPEDRDLFKQWSDALVGSDQGRFLQCQREMSVYFADVAKRRRKEPQDDLIGRLVAASVENERLSGLELIGFCMLLLVAGNETTTNWISSAIWCLDSDEAARSALVEGPEAISRALEEVLRYCSPVQNTVRRITRDTELRGHRLAAGQTVNVRLGSANRDEDVFDRPELFDIARYPNPHLAFGYGIHYCMGALLARLEAQVAIRALLARFPRFSRDRSQPLERQDSWIVFGLKRMPLVLNR